MKRICFIPLISNIRVQRYKYEKNNAFSREPLIISLGGNMDQLSVYQAIELIRINENAISTQFQVWLTITFSTIVAVFAGRSLLTKVIKWLVTMLYLLSSIATVASSIYLAESNAHLTAILMERGANVPPPIFAGIIYFMLFVAGVGTTVYFIHMNLNDMQDST